ncbi:MAG: hypothetical protein CME80_08525 [Halomonas sp.]|nr:hypothetical protein [Halomonas sp.]MBF57749.1 hypothetical protein [Halomonas sp.]
MAGLLAGAMMGLGEGINQSGNFLLRAKADEIKEARLQKYEMAREQRQNQRQDVQWNRETEAASAAAQIDERRRQEDRQWELSDAERKQQHDLRIAGMRASGRGASTPSRVTEAEILVSRGVYPSFQEAYQAVRASAGQLDPAELARDELEYYSGQLESIMEDLNDPAVRAGMADSEIERLEERAEDIRSRTPSLEQKAFGSQGAAPPPQVVAPPPTLNSGTNPPARERGLLPGPRSGQEGDINSSADAILNKFF